MSHLLTSQGVRKLLAPKDNNRIGGPIVVQVIHIKSVPSNQGERFRVVLSDGENFVQGMMSSQMNSMVSDGTLQTNGLLAVEDHMANDVQNKTIVILLSAHPLDQNPGEKIGAPVDVARATGPNATGNNATNAPPQPLYNSTNSNNNSNPYSNNNNPYSNNANNNKPVNTTGSSNDMQVSPPRSSSSVNPYGNPYSRSSSSTPAVPTSSAAAPIVRSSGPSNNFTKISDLNLYHSRWTIQARVTNKSQIRTWSNAKGEGSLFSVSLLDESGTDIRATFFKEAVDRFYPMLEEGKVYTFSGGKLKVANARYNTCKSKHEVTFDQNSEIHLSNAGNTNIQKQSYDFQESIASIESIQLDPETPSIVDVLALVQSIGDPTTLISKKKGQEFTKCDVTLVDDSNAQINLTLWSEQALQASSLVPVNEFVAVCRARISDYGGGKSLSGAQALVQVKHEAALQQSPHYQRLQEWYQQTGGQGPVRSLSGPAGGAFGGPAPFSERKCIADIKREQLGLQSEKGDYISFAATVAFLRKDKEGGAWYPACPNPEPPCKNMCKVTPSASMAGGDSWSCERCNGTFDKCVRRWIFSAVIEDPSGSTWVTFFNETAEALLEGKTADEIYEASEGNAPSSDAYDSVFAKASYTEWIFKCRVKNEIVNEEMKRKTQVAAIHPVNYVQESNDLLKAIASF